MLLNCGVREDSRVPWTARWSNQSILKEISPEYSLEGLMLKLKLQCFGHLMQRANSLEKTLMLGKIEGRRRGWGRQRMRWLDDHRLNGHKFEQTLRDSVWRGAWHAAVHGLQRVGHDLVTEQKQKTGFTLNNPFYITNEKLGSDVQSLVLNALAGPAPTSTPQIYNLQFFNWGIPFYPTC